MCIRDRYLDVVNNLENEALGSRKIPFSRELYIEREDFMEEPPKKYFRMFPGNEVRLMNADVYKRQAARSQISLSLHPVSASTSTWSPAWSPLTESTQLLFFSSPIRKSCLPR